MVEFLGVLGIVISVAAYMPQVIHLAREHCSAGISRRAWAMWLVGGLLLGVVALERGDPIFLGLQLNTLVSAAVILVLARRYRGMACSGHTGKSTGPSTSSTDYEIQNLNGMESLREG